MKDKIVGRLIEKIDKVATMKLYLIWFLSAISAIFSFLILKSEMIFWLFAGICIILIAIKGPIGKWSSDKNVK